MVTIGSDTNRRIDDVELSRYACYLIVQTDEKLRRENVKGKEAANEVHTSVGKAVRMTIKELGGTMPEDLPTPDKSVKKIEKEDEQKKLK